jgi:diguanylate cyclase (GGDEF)-like protein
MTWVAVVALLLGGGWLHALGDEMLKYIARAVEHEVRRSDYVARYGGDEFAILLPGCTLEDAREIAEKLRGAVAEIVVTHQERAATASP